MQAGVSIITPTGGRPLAFSLCEQYLRRQTYAGRLQWIIVDDCIPSIPEIKSRPGWEISVINPSPSWSPSDNTLARNLRAALQEAHYDTVLIMEDDDWYAPEYIYEVFKRIHQDPAFLIVGCQESRYYHITSGKYRVFSHMQTSSLCHTGLRYEAVNQLYNACAEEAIHIDRYFWDRFKRFHKGFLTRPLCVGIKGLPGRPGLGMGHYPEDTEGWQVDDSDQSVLRSWIGNDAIKYAGFQTSTLSKIEVATRDVGR